MMTLIGSQDLCKLLYYNSNTPLSEPYISDTTSLLFTHLYPTPIVPQPTDESKSLITIVLDDFATARNNTAYRTSRILFNVICHIDLWLIDGGIRPYSILNEIDKLFNQQRIATIGKLEFANGRWMAINDSWQGYQISYKVTDFNV